MSAVVKKEPVTPQAAQTSMRMEPAVGKSETILSLSSVPGLKKDLEDHQLRAIERMGELEDNLLFCGGVLADESGLGKKVTMLGLIMQRKSLGANKRRGTLIITSTGDIKLWTKAINEMVNDKTLAVMTNHGKNRRYLKLEYADIVITTALTLLSDFNGCTQPVFNMKWDRVVVDHHTPINGGNASTEACLQLNANHRWLLSANPLIHGANSVRDIFAFLNISSSDATNFGRKFSAIQDFTIRRLNEDIVKTAPKVESIPVDVTLSDDEYCAYEEMSYLMTKFSEYHTDIPKLLIQTPVASAQRMMLAHPTTAITERVREKLKKMAQYKPGSYDSSIDTVKSIVRKYEPASDSAERLAPSSAKVSAVLSTLIAERKRNPAVKAVVCTETCPLVPILAGHIKSSGFNALKLNAGMTQRSRDQVATKFIKTPGPAVLVGTSTNIQNSGDLSCASTIVFESQWWNPDRHDKCIDRIVNHGRNSPPVRAYYVHASGTIDDKIREKQQLVRTQSKMLLDRLTKAEPIHLAGVQDVKY